MGPLLLSRPATVPRQAQRSDTLCNQQVRCSSHPTSSNLPFRHTSELGEFPSGQRGRTVNLLSVTSVVRIHLPPPKSPISYGYRTFCTILLYTDKGEFIRCPCCGEKTRTKIRDDTILIRHLLYCPKCKAELLVNIRKKSITILERLDAKTQGQ